MGGYFVDFYAERWGGADGGEADRYCGRCGLLARVGEGRCVEGWCRGRGRDCGERMLKRWKRDGGGGRDSWE